MKTRFSKIQHDDQRINLIQDRIGDTVNFCLESLLIDADYLEGISIVTGSNTISHKLGRKLQGWIVARINAAITLFDTQDTNLLPERTLLLTASGPAKVSLVVF